MDHAVPAAHEAALGKKFTDVKGSLTLLGSSDLKWNIGVNVESELMDVKSSVNVKLARLTSPSLDLPARSLYANVKTEWGLSLLDCMEIPSPTKPSAERDVQLVCDQTPANKRPIAAKDVMSLPLSSSGLSALGSILDTQRKTASDRIANPFDRCDVDRTGAGNSGTTTPMTKVRFRNLLINHVFKDSLITII